MASTQKFKYLSDEKVESLEVKELEDNGVEIDEKSNGIVIIDGDGNYYFQESDNLIEIENMVEIATAKFKDAAQTVKNSTKKAELENNLEEETNLNATILENGENEREVYEFNENEEEVDDPQVVVDADYETKGVIKSIKTSNTDETFNCAVCAYKTNKKFLLSKHMKIHSDERPYKCGVCERGFKSSSSLINHKNTHLGRKPHACKDCDKAFTTSGELVRHVRYRHTHIKPHKCTECEYRSVEMSKLRRHMRCHTGERPYQCPHCTYASPDTFKLKRHLRTHTGEKPYECDICHARFTQRNSLKYHRLIHSVNEKPVFQCHLCPTTCGRKTDLRLHIKKLHCSDQPIPCKRCNMMLPDRYSYKMHVKTHQGEKCHRCSYCPYASVSQRHLEAHISIHLDEKPFECEICQTSFRQKQLYSRHMKIFHSDNYVPPQARKKDRKCPHCDKMFAFNGYLIRHMETHDPNSRLSEEKYNLKLGRMKRVQKDGTVISVPENNTVPVVSEEYIYEEIEEPEVKNEGLNEEEEYDVNYNNDDNLNYVYEDFETDDYEEESHENETKNEQDLSGKKLLVEVKVENGDGMNNEKPQTQQEFLSKFKTESNIVNEVLESSDDQDFVVIEVLPDDDGEDDTIENEAQTIQKNSPKYVFLNNKENTNNQAISLTDYFGFEVDEEEDEEADETIKLFEMIEQE